MVSIEHSAWLSADPRPVVVVLSGAGISAESGIPTFRDANGLWEGHDVLQVATPQGFGQNPALVLRFYNERRKAATSVQPNAGHAALAELEKQHNVVIITQNVDDLHERAGSTKVLHLHGELRKVRSTGHPHLVYDIGGEAIEVGSLCEKGTQLRPHVVWFGEEVPCIYDAQWLASQADYLLVVGTSLVVYPAAGLVDFTPEDCPIYVVNPNMPDLPQLGRAVVPIAEPATTGVPKAIQMLLENQATAS